MGGEEKHIIEIKASKANIILGFAWKFIEKCASQAANLIISLILARLLSPSDYGVIALISIFIQISSIIITNGFSTSLIQKRDTDLLDFSSVFYFTLFLSLVMYLILFFMSPYIAIYYGNLQIKDVLRIISLQLFPQAIYSVQNAYVSRSMQFKKLFWCSLSGTVLGGSVGIILALKGAGVWALVAQSIMSSVVTMCILFLAVNWRPQLKFSITRIKALLNFGFKMLGIGLLDSVFSNIYSIIVGKAYSVERLGIYNKGQQFPQIIYSSIESAVAGVALPVLSACNDNVDAVRQLDRKFIKGYTFIIIPCLMGLGAVSKPLIIVLLTEKWTASISFLRLFCFVYVTYILNSMNVHALYALGKSGIVLKMQIVKKIVILIGVAISVRYGIRALVLSQFFQGVFECLLHSYAAKKVFYYNYAEQIVDILPQLLCAVFMYIIVSMIAFFNMPMVLQLLIQILVGIVTYLLVSKIFKIPAYNMFIGLFKEKFINSIK